MSVTPNGITLAHQILDLYDLNPAPIRPIDHLAAELARVVIESTYQVVYDRGFQDGVQAARLEGGES